MRRPRLNGLRNSNRLVEKLLARLARKHPGQDIGIQQMPLIHVGDPGADLGPRLHQALGDKNAHRLAVADLDTWRWPLAAISPSRMVPALSCPETIFTPRSPAILAGMRSAGLGGSIPAL